MKTPALFSVLRSKKFITVFFTLAFLTFFSFLALGTAFAQNQTYEPEYKSSASERFNTNSDVRLNTHNTIQILVIELLAATSCQLSGVDPTGPDGKCLGINSKTGKIGYLENNGGAIAVVGNLIDATFVPPVSGTQYIAYLKNNFGIAKSAYAQQPPPNACLNNERGLGFCGLLPVLGLWTSMRNIVYLIFILVFMVIGIGIMLRLHIDPRTVMTIQNQIPKIIVGILAITFSFAIAGFLIDVMWVTIYLFASVITNATQNNLLDTQTAINITHANSPFDAANIAYPGGIIDLTSGSARAFSEVIREAWEAILPDFDILGDILAEIVNALAFVIILIVIIIVLIRLLIMLIITYINIILDVIFAPFWILAGLLPGGPLGLGAWLRDLTANLAVFPVTIAFFLLGSYFVNYFTSGAGNANGQLTPPMMGGANPAAIGALIGLGFLLMLPQILKTVKAAFKTPNLSFGPILQPVGSVTRGMAGAPGRTLGFAERWQYGAERGVSPWRRFTGNPIMWTDEHKPPRPAPGPGVPGGGGSHG